MSDEPTKKDLEQIEEDIPELFDPDDEEQEAVTFTDEDDDREPISEYEDI